jgi:hypothetical protein
MLVKPLKKYSYGVSTYFSLSYPNKKPKLSYPVLLLIELETVQSSNIVSVDTIT